MDESRATKDFLVFGKGLNFPCDKSCGVVGAVVRVLVSWLFEKFKKVTGNAWNKGCNRSFRGVT